MTPEDDKIVDTTKVGVNNSFGAPIAKSADRLERERVVSKEPVRPDRTFTIPKRGRYVVTGGQVIKTTGSDYISDTEEEMYKQSAITEMHLQQAKIEQTRARLAGNPITLDEAAQRVRIQDVDVRVNPGTGAAVQPGDIYSKRPLSPEEIQEQAEEKFPILAMQAKVSGLSKEEQSAVVSLPLAVDVVRRISQTRNPSRQQQIINTMGPDMQALVMDIITAWQAEAEKNVEASAEQSGGNAITDAIGFAWDRAIGPTLELLFEAAEVGVRGIATAAVLGNSVIEGQGMDPIEAWEATQPGVFDPYMVDYAKKRYGAETVDVILEALEVQNSENPDEGIAKMWDKYASEGDMERLSILEQAMSLSSYDKNTMDAITYLASSDLGNLGNRFSWSFLTMRGVDPNTPEGAEAVQSPLFTGTRDAVNVISLFAADPVSRGATIANIYKIQKYGLSKMSPEQIEKTFATGGVKNFFDTFGASLAKADSLADKTQSAQMINSLRSQYKNWLTPDAIEAMRKAKVFSADDAANFYKDARNLELMVKGQRAKRADQVTIPHMVKASAYVKRGSLVARGLTYDRNSGKKIDEIFGDGVSSMLPEEAIPIIIDRLASPNGDKFVGRMLSDFVYANGTAKRTFLGKILGTTGAKPYQSIRYGASRYGFKRKGGARERIERLARTQAHVPDMSGGLNIATGKDAYKIRDLMMYGGMPKYWADYSAQLWKTMNAGERKQFATGIGRSVGYSLGVDIVDPVTGAKLIDNIVSGLRPGELYSPNFIDMPLISAGINKQAKVQSGNTKIFDSLSRDAKAAGIKLDDPRGGDTIAREVYNYRFNKLTKSDPKIKTINNKQFDFNDDYTYQAYMRAFYPEVTDDTVVTLYRGLKEGEDIFRTPGAGQADFAPGFGSYWSTNPVVAKGFGANSKVVAIDVRFGDIKNFEVSSGGKPKNTILGPLDEVYGSEDAIILDYTKIPDSVKQSVKTVDVEIPTGSLNYYDGFGKMSKSVAAERERALAVEAFDAPMYNPSMLPDGTSAALYEYQMTDVIGFPNMAALDQMSLRQSYLTALLGDNKTMTTVTDYWTLGTIGGPRFFLRNGLEDAGLYALTGGSWKDYRYGQLYSRAKREATQRTVSKAGEVRGQKLGLAVTSLRYLGDSMPKALNSIILPHLDEAEIAAAKTMAANGDRSALVSLISKAFMRQKLLFINRPKNPEVIRYLDEAAEDAGFFSMMDEASETTENLASGSMVGISGSNVNRAILNGEIQDVKGIILPYKSMDVRPDNPESIRAWRNNINAIVYGDGKSGQKTLSMLKSYYAAKTSGNANAIERVTKEYAEWLEENASDAMKSSAIYATEGAGSMARRKLDDALRVFTSKDGEFNDELLDTIKQVKTAKDGTQYEAFTLYDTVDGKLVDRLTEETLLNMNKKPLSVLGVDNVVIPTTDKLPLTTRAWSAMGRSLARLTREPIFVANYLDARKLYAPIEKKMAEEYGEAYAKKWAVRNGYDRAFDLTMSYVDDPNVRSQMAWSVRNVSRFYRAQEDFFRRMMRTGRNNPMAIQRLNLAWHAMDETGFIHEDEMGDKYFMWPGNKTTINAINAITSKLGFNVLEGAGLADFSSKVTMLTPSADPSGLPPTLAGPYAALTYPALMAMFPSLSEIQSEVMGEYSVGRSAWDMVFPTMAKSLWDAGTVLAGRSTTAESETAFADSARAAVQIYAASGRFDENKIMSATDIGKLKDELAVVGNDIAFYKAMTRPVSAAVMQLNPQSVTDFAKSMGISGMRKLFIELLKVNDGDFELAMSKWIKGNPGLSIFTVSENSNPDSFGSFDATKETQKFIEENEELFKISQVGSAFFAPQEGVQSLNAWKYLASMGAKTTKSVDEYFNQMVTAQGYAMYRNLQRQYYDLVESGDETADDKWTNAKKTLFLAYPMLESRIRGGNLSDRSIPNPADARSEIEDIRTAVNWMDENGKLDDRGKNAMSVIKLYDQAKGQMQSLNPQDPSYDKSVSRIRGLWKNAYAQAINLYPQEDVQWRLLLNAVTDALDTRIN